MSSVHHTSRYRNLDSDPRGPYVLTDITASLERPQFSYEWNGRRPPPGRSWRYSAKRMEQWLAEGRIVLSSSGFPRLKRYLDEAGRPEQSPVIDPAARLELIIRPAMQKMAEVVARDPACLRWMEWRDLERMMREVFEGLGFSTELTRSSKDGGFDLCLESEGVEGKTIFLVEVKHWIGTNKKPGVKEVTALLDVVVRSSSASGGLLLSSTGFTKDALRGRTEIQQQTIRLGGREKIVTLCQDYLQSDAGLLVPTTELARMLVQDTC